MRYPMPKVYQRSLKILQGVGEFFTPQCNHCFHEEQIIEEDINCKKGVKYIERHLAVCCNCAYSKPIFNFWGEPIIFYKERKTVGVAILLLVSLTACGFPAWRDQTYRDVMAGRLQVDPAQVGSAGQPSQTIEFYDASGRHTGYGKVQDGTVDLFNADSSRAGVGRER